MRENHKILVFIIVLGFFLTTQAASVPGDLNGDGCVDGRDFAALTAGWSSTYNVAELNAVLENFGTCPARIEFVPEGIPTEEIMEGATVDLEIRSSKPFNGTIFYSLRGPELLDCDQDLFPDLACSSASIMTDGPENIATLSVTLPPPEAGFQLGENVVVTILDDDQPRDYVPGTFYNASIGIEDSTPLVSGLWAAQVTLTHREGETEPEALPTGIVVPLFFRYNAAENTVEPVELPQVLPNISYVRQVNDGVFVDPVFYQPMGSVAARSGFVMEGHLVGDTFEIQVEYDVDPVIWGERLLRPDQRLPADDPDYVDSLVPPGRRTLNVSFPLPATNDDRLTATIEASEVHEETVLWEQDGVKTSSVLLGSGVMQYYAPDTIPNLENTAALREGDKEKGLPSERFLASLDKRLQREARAGSLEIAPPSYNVRVGTADFANTIPLSPPPDSAESMFLANGGAYLGTAGEVALDETRSRLSEPFESVPASLVSTAAVLRDLATGFRLDTALGVTKGGLPIQDNGNENYTAQIESGTPLGTIMYDGTQARRSEKIYVQAIAANPFDNVSLEGLLETRIRRALWYNLLADRQALDAWNVKYEFSLLEGITTLEREQDEFEIVAGHALTASRLLFTLFDDRQRLGVGEVMRLTHPNSAALEDKRREVVEIAAESMRRWSEAKRRVIHLDMLKDFLDDDARDAALEASIEAQIVIEEAIRLLVVYSMPEEIDGAPELQIYSNASIGLLEGELSQMRLIEQNIRQGLNAFGFVSDFVPFLVTNNQQSEADNVVRARQLASNLISVARTYESEAEQNLNQFVNDQVQYANRINELNTSYNERLRALVGVLEIRRTDGSALPPGVDRFFPDLLTYAMPPGDDVQREIIEGVEPEKPDRDFLLENEALVMAGYELSRRSYGQIWNQYLNIQNAEDRIQIAVEDLEANYEEMRIIEETANEIAGIQDRIIARIISDGQETVLLIKELGRLEKEAILAAARANKKAKKKTGIFNAISSVVSGLSGGINNGLFDGGEDGSEWGTLGGWAGAIGGLVQGGLSLAGNRAEIKALTAVANIQANLAEASANIQAQIQEIQFLQQAEIRLGDQQIGLLRAEERLKLLALQQARLALAIRIAERDYLRELLVLDGMMAEVDSLLADAARHQQLAAQTAGIVEGFSRRDYRHAFKASQADAEAALVRAQAATFMTIRALDYYLNESQSIGLIYDRLHAARRSTHLEAVLADVDQALSINPVIIASDCPVQTNISLKYNLIASGDAFFEDDTSEGATLFASDTYTYFDSVAGVVVTGEQAYQARLRDFLRNSLTGEPGNLRLEFSFTTDVFQRQRPNQSDLPEGTPDDYVFAQNPLFFSTNTRSQTFIGFTPQQCQFETTSLYHGLEVNFRGNGLPTERRYVITLRQEGNMYLRSGRQDIGFDPNNQLAAMNVYSSYRQRLPVTLRLSGTGESSYETLPGSRQADFSPRVNNENVSGATGRTLIFTDRAIACDKWVLIMDETTQGQGTPAFLEALDAALDAAYDPVEPVPFTLLLDIEFGFGWVPKFAQ